MKGNTQVIAALNELLSNELSAMDQYFIHARMYHDWGLHKLFERIDHEFDDEKGHASALIERIIFLGGKPETFEPIAGRARNVIGEELGLTEAEVNALSGGSAEAAPAATAIATDEAGEESSAS